MPKCSTWNIPLRVAFGLGLPIPRTISLHFLRLRRNSTTLVVAFTWSNPSTRGARQFDGDCSQHSPVLPRDKRYAVGLEFARNQRNSLHCSTWNSLGPSSRVGGGVIPRSTGSSKNSQKLAIIVVTPTFLSFFQPGDISGAISVLELVLATPNS